LEDYYEKTQAIGCCAVCYNRGPGCVIDCDIIACGNCTYHRKCECGRAGYCVKLYASCHKCREFSTLQQAYNDLIKLSEECEKHPTLENAEQLNKLQQSILKNKVIHQINQLDEDAIKRVIPELKNWLKDIQKQLEAEHDFIQDIKPLQDQDYEP
jgi:hypothetical protein